jgi:hypothetical protein
VISSYLRQTTQEFWKRESSPTLRGYKRHHSFPFETSIELEERRAPEAHKSIASAIQNSSVAAIDNYDSAQEKKSMKKPRGVLQPARIAVSNAADELTLISDVKSFIQKNLVADGLQYL